MARAIWGRDDTTSPRRAPAHSRAERFRSEAQIRQTPPVELSDWRRWWKETGGDELRALLIATWDPLFVKDDPLAPVDEYDSYALPLARKLREGASADEVAAFAERGRG